MTGRLPPSDDVCTAARQLWRRISARFQNSRIWRAAPREVIATEFLALLRYCLAPLRVEAAIYDLTTGNRPFAATLPQSIVPQAGDVATFPVDGGLDAAQFFDRGKTAVEEWLAGLPALDEPLRGVVETYASYLRRFGDTCERYELTPDGTLSLLIYADGSYSRDMIAALVATSGIGALLAERTPAASRDDLWHPAHRRLNDHLRFVLENFLDRLENDLAISAGSDTPDIWVLLLDERTRRLRFHCPLPKLDRVRLHYKSQALMEGAADATVRQIRRRVEIGDPGGLREHLAVCASGFHDFLTGSWSDDAPLKVEHLECIAEKFYGWPVDRGIAGAVAASGCGDVVREFGKDYRVEAYSYSGGLRKLPDESDEFYRVRLAERVFIGIRPHLLELPLLWGRDEQGRSRCMAMLLVLFNGESQNSAPDHFARQALSVRGVVEPWYLLFEQHSELMELNSAVHGQMVHELNGIFQEFEREVSEESRATIEARRQRLWEAHSFVRDRRGVHVAPMVVKDFVSAVVQTASGALAADKAKRFRCESRVELDQSSQSVLRVDTEPKLLRLLLHGFFSQSRAVLANVVAVGSDDNDARRIDLRFSLVTGALGNTEHVRVEVQHAATTGVVAAVKEYGSLMGQAPIVTEDTKRAKLGLFYMGIVFRAWGGEFVRPSLDAVEKQIKWSFLFRAARHPNAAVTEDRPG